MRIEALQEALREHRFDGWLFYDFHNRDALSYRVLGLPFNKLTSRRWYYWVPSSGEPVRLVHRVEPAKLDALPGAKIQYHAWEELHSRLREILGPAGRTVAMQYSPMNAIPYVSLVDAGTVELVRSFGHRVVSSADLVQRFEAVISEEGYRSHVEASRLLYRIKDEAFRTIRESLCSPEPLTEFDVQRFILRRFEEEGLDCGSDPPIVGVNGHPANPHFEPTAENAWPIRRGDAVLIDLWAKLGRPGAVYADITWCGFCGAEPPEEYARIFRVVRDARRAALDFVRDRFSRGQACAGWEVDEACRAVVRGAGYADRFIHRTGHSIGEEVHGNGVNIDNLETKEERLLIPGVCFSIEPGIYLEDRMAVRTEINVFIRASGEVTVSGEEQQELVCLFP
jgi:Xaa-Pro aminopeptidase